MKELKVGERITLEVVESSTCKGCCLTDLDFCPQGCVAKERSDGKNIIFKEVKE